MTETKFTDPKSGWVAECQDCLHTIDPKYGAPIYPKHEATGPDAIAEVEAWARDHNAEHPDHQPKIQQFHRWTLEVGEWSPTLLEKLFGPAAAANSSDASTSGNEEV
jgi:hypothetical protein